MLNFAIVSLSDMEPGTTVLERVADNIRNAILLHRFSVPIAEITGATISFSFVDLDRLQQKYGQQWLAAVFAGLDANDTTIIRNLVEIGARGVRVETLLDALPLDRLAAYIAAGLLIRLK